MAFQFWRKVERTDIFYLEVQQDAKRGLEAFSPRLEDRDVQRGFWRYILDKDDFSQWPRECKKELIKKALFEGFTTLTHYPQAMAITLAATSLSLFVLSFVMGTTLTFFTCIMTTALICAASYFMDSDEELEHQQAQEITAVHF